MRLTILVAQPVSVFRGKLWKVVMKYEIALFSTFGFFSKFIFSRLRHFISPSTYPINSTFFNSSVLPFTNHCYDNWENVFFLFPWKPSLWKYPFIKSCSLSIQTILETNGIRYIKSSKEKLSQRGIL